MATWSPLNAADAGGAAWRCAGTLDELWDGEMQAVSFGATSVVLCNVGGQVSAFADSCPHLASLLSEGSLSGEVLTCAAHEWAFNARTGQGINPATAALRRYPVRLDGDTILVDLASGR